MPSKTRKKGGLKSGPQSPINPPGPTRSQDLRQLGLQKSFKKKNKSKSLLNFAKNSISTLGNFLGLNDASTPQAEKQERKINLKHIKSIRQSVEDRLGTADLRSKEAELNKANKAIKAAKQVNPSYRSPINSRRGGNKRKSRRKPRRKPRKKH